MFVPVRWQRRFYTPDGQHLVLTAWRLTAAMYGLAVLGICVVVVTV